MALKKNEIHTGAEAARREPITRTHVQMKRSATSQIEWQWCKANKTVTAGEYRPQSGSRKNGTFSISFFGLQGVIQYWNRSSGSRLLSNKTIRVLLFQNPDFKPLLKPFLSSQVLTSSRERQSHPKALTSRADLITNAGSCHFQTRSLARS